MTSRLIETFADSPKRVRIMFRIALITLLGAGCYNWTIKPEASYLYAAHQRSQLAAKLSDQQNQTHLSINSLKKQIDDLKAQSEQFQKILFQPDTVRKFFCGLETQAEKSGCRIESLSFNIVDSQSLENNSQDAIVRAMQASMIAIGTYDAFIRFFKETGQYSQKISIHELRFEPLIQGQSILRCNAVITVYVANTTADGKY